MSVLVVGGINLDTIVRIDADVRLGTSNPGRRWRSPGGVARNVAENLSRLGRSVRLVGAVGHEPDSEQVLELLVDAGVDVTDVRRTRETIGSYTAILDPAGELVVGVADMAATESLAPSDLPGEVTGVEFVVVDANLRRDTVLAALGLAAAAGIPAALDPVGAAKAARLGGSEPMPLHTFTPTRDELAAFAGTGDLDAGLARAHDRGIALVWLREGPAGSRLFTADAAPVAIPAHTGTVVDVTGAGDAMLAGYVHALLDGETPDGAARYGAAAAALTIASDQAVRSDLDDVLVRRTLSSGFAEAAP